MSKKKVVVLGGGTGTFTTLCGLREFPDLELSAVVSVADDGGSTGRLRSEYGVLPPGDIYRCLVALSEESQILRQAFDYRFDGGGIDGHRFGNLFLTVLEKVCMGDRLAAMRAAHNILKVRGRVIPVSAQEGNLYANLKDGTLIDGEHEIDSPNSQRAEIEDCFLDPEIQANPHAIAAIREADLIVLAPGDLFTSLIPVLLVKGIPQALQDTEGKIVYAVSLTTKKGQTHGFGASRFCAEVQKYLRPASVDIVLMNTTPPDPHLVARYVKTGAHLVQDDFSSDAPFQVVRGDLISNELPPRVPGDKLERSLIRHDSKKLARAILSLL